MQRYKKVSKIFTCYQYHNDYFEIFKGKKLKEVKKYGEKIIRNFLKLKKGGNYE